MLELVPYPCLAASIAQVSGNFRGKVLFFYPSLESAGEEGLSELGSV